MGTELVLTEKQQAAMVALARFYRLNPDAKTGRGNAGLSMAALSCLSDIGLVHTCHGVVVRTYRVFLTDAGKQVACGICFDEGING